MPDPSDLSDLLRRAEPPTADFTVADVMDRAAAHRRRTRVTSATIIALLCITVVGVVLAARPELTVQVIGPPSVPVAMDPSEPAAVDRLDGEVLGAVRTVQEEETRGIPTGWRVRDGDPVWWLSRGINPDGTWCLVPGTAEGTEMVSGSEDCGVVPFAILDVVAGDDLVSVVVPDGYDQATHDGATLAVEHNVAILPADGSPQPVVRVTGPAGTLDLIASTTSRPPAQPTRFTFDGGSPASEADIAAVLAEVTEPGAPTPSVALATDRTTTTTTTVVLQIGDPPDGAACIGLVTAERTRGSCTLLQGADQIVAGPLLAAVAVDGVRAYLVADGWETLRLPNGEDAAVIANTVTIPARAQDAASGLLQHSDGTEVVVSLHHR